MIILYLFLPKVKLNDIAIKQRGGFAYSWNLVSQINYRLAQLRKMYKVLANNLCVSMA